MSIIRKTMKAGKVVKQAFKTQAALRKLKAELAEEEFAGVDESGAVEAVVRGDHRVVSIRATSADSVEAIRQAVNAAIDKADEEAQRRTKEITGGTALDAFDMAV